MSIVSATLRLYAQAAARAASAFARSAWALVWLLVCVPALALVEFAAAPLGIAGGFLIGFAQAVAAGTYLATLHDALTSTRPLGPGILRANFGRWMWDVINILFPLFVLDIALSAIGSSVVSLAVAVATFVLLNPVPELVGRTRSGGLDALGEAWRFMGNNGFEWLIPQAVPIGLAALLMPGKAISILALFGPRMDFIHTGRVALGGSLGSPAGWAVAFGLVAVVHLAMLFRGALYDLLGSGSRRAREWRARMG